jgi:hypothetical protein
VNLDPIFSTFDFASPDAATPQRPQTLVPQQALFAMNHPFVIEQARSLASAAAQGGSNDAARRVDVMYRRLFGRGATPDETAAVLAFINAPAPTEAAPVGVWQYGYGSIDLAASPEDRFTPLPYWTGNSYQIGAEYPDPKLGHLKLTATGGHPGRNAQHAVIRRWSAPADLTITIEGELQHARDAGDGIAARIVAGRGGVLGEWRAFNSSTPTKVESYQVAQGETIDFVVECVKTASADVHLWAPVIRVVEQADPAKKGPLQEWSAEREFAPPPAPLLTPWEQVAQALLLTNEFMYVD